MIRIPGVSLLFAIVCFGAHPGRANPAGAKPFSGTTLLEWEEEDHSDRILDEAHAYVESKIESAASRGMPLPRDAEARSQFLEESRERLRTKLGVVDARSPVHVEFFNDSAVSLDGIPQASRIAEGPGFDVFQVRWAVLPGFTAEGLYVTPTAGSALPSSPPAMILFPDAGETPEDVMGLNGTLPGRQQMGLRFASAGFRILIPTSVSRDRYESSVANESVWKKIDQTNREWIYRQAFQMGRHPLGYEIQSALAAIDWLTGENLASSITLAGYGEGGRVALYATAIDPRIDHAFVSGAFASRASAWSEPIYRNVFGLLPEHGDAEVAALIAPRPLLIEHTEFPSLENQKGSLSTPDAASVETEFNRTADVLGTFGTPSSFLFHRAKTGTRADFPGVAAFLQTIGLEREVSRIPPIALLIDSRTSFDAKPRQDRVRDGMQTHVQSILDQSESTRREFFFYAAEPELRPGKWSVKKSHPTLDPAGFIEAARQKRESFHTEVIGRFDDERVPPVALTRKLKETDDWTAWDVAMEVYPGFHAWGTLLLPKGFAEEERRPVIVCQHGRNGVPRDTIDANKDAYNDFAARLAERGFITFAPFNLYRGEDRYRWLDRKANLIGATLFSFITDSHAQQLDWLKTLPQVDPDRIAFYGLSYGGETAVRVPAILEDYCLSICSGDFNQWTRKVADPQFPKTFMKSIEWEMPYWNMGNTFDYGELAGLIFPRPFFVERGHHDGVSQDEWVAYEYARVRRLYSAFGLSEKTGIEFFHGGHSIHGRGSFDFLHEQLNWPKP